MRNPILGKRIGSVLGLATAFLAPTAVLAQSTSGAGDFGGVLYIWVAILVVGGIGAGLAAFAVAGQVSRRP